jgi:hypothetical protein
VIDWRRRTKNRAIAYKGGACIICGYNKCSRALEFHHVDPSKKEFRISTGNARAWSKIKAELDKCVLLCCRCHAEFHDGLITLPQQ